MIWIIPGIILVLVIILLSRIYIECNYTYQSKQQILHMKLSLYHIRLFKKEINLSEKQSGHAFEDLSIDNFLEKMKKMVHLLQSLHSIVNLLLSKINIHQLHWTTGAGTGDAATTGVAGGALWAIKSVLIGFMTEKVRQIYNKPDIRIIPYYNRSCLQSQLNCIVSIRVGQAIHAFLKMMMLLSNKEKVYI